MARRRAEAQKQEETDLGEVSVVEVHDKGGIADFLAAARSAQSSNPRWVEPAHEEICTLLDRKRSPLAEELETRAFVAYRAGAPAPRWISVMKIPVA